MHPFRRTHFSARKLRIFQASPTLRCSPLCPSITSTVTSSCRAPKGGHLSPDTDAKVQAQDSILTDLGHMCNPKLVTVVGMERAHCLGSDREVAKRLALLSAPLFLQEPIRCLATLFAQSWLPSDPTIGKASRVLTHIRTQWGGSSYLGVSWLRLRWREGPSFSSQGDSSSQHHVSSPAGSTLPIDD